MDDWQQRLADTNQAGPLKLVIAHLHPGEVSTSWQQSLMNTIAYDQAHNQRLFDQRGRLGLISSHAGAGQLDRARNEGCAKFLDEHPDADLLMFIDSDMGWDADTVERLALTMEVSGLPIVGGLCFGQRVAGIGAQQSMAVEFFPTLYQWVESGGFDTAHEYPPDALVEVGATGAAFVMISRACLEGIRAAEGDTWFTPVDVAGRRFGEDMSFAIRARRCGFPLHVDTGAKASHMKSVWFTDSDYRMLRRPSASAVTVVIPVKDNLAMTRDLVGQLFAQGGFTDLILFDNGSTDPAMREWLESQQVADVFDASECPGGISQMWNAGIDEAVRRHRGLADVVFLNNDVRVGPQFLQRLVHGLRSSTAQAVCANYDGRKGTGVLPVRGICANRYDGQGGLAGFAFALRAEWLAGGFRFDEGMAWWFSDNDLCLSVEKAGGWYGVVADATCVHLDGGSNTATPDWWGERVEMDRAAFAAKWPDVQLVPAS